MGAERCNVAAVDRDSSLLQARQALGRTDVRALPDAEPCGQPSLQGSVAPPVSTSGSALIEDMARLGAQPACPNMEKVSFIVPNFQPSGDDIPSGDLEVQGCSNDKLDAVEGKKGVVVFLHGSGGHADDYAKMYPNQIYLPSDFNIIFLQTPRPKGSHWMGLYERGSLDHHWVNSHVVDNMDFLSKVLDQVAEPYGGLEHVRIAGFSQGGVMSAAMALRGTRRLLAGAFVVAGYPVRGLYTDDIGAKGAPSDWSSAEVENKKKTNIYFYTLESWTLCYPSASRSVDSTAW